MDLPGEAYLFNLSILSITVAVVSALVMLVRQTLGGKLSNFDIFLIEAFVSWGLSLRGLRSCRRSSLFSILLPLSSGQPLADWLLFSSPS